MILACRVRRRPGVAPAHKKIEVRKIRTSIFIFREEPRESKGEPRATTGCGAGDGNRTHVRSLGSSYSAIELRPQNLTPVAEREGFEPPIPLRVCMISSHVHSTRLCHLSSGKVYFIKSPSPLQDNLHIADNRFYATYAGGRRLFLDDFEGTEFGSVGCVRAAAYFLRHVANGI